MRVLSLTNAQFGYIHLFAFTPDTLRDMTTKGDRPYTDQLPNVFVLYASYRYATP